MGTRSDIIAKLSDGTFKRIYCHWDGYLEHNGRILFEHYTSQEQVEALMALGNLSSLGPQVGVKHPWERPSAVFWGGKKSGQKNPAYTRHMKLYGDMCVAYGRDRGEKNVAGKGGETLQAVWPEEGTDTEFTYVWDGERWLVGDPDEGTQTLIDLGDALLGKKTLVTAVKAFGWVIGEHKPTKPGEDHSWGAYKGGPFNS